MPWRPLPALTEARNAARRANQTVDGTQTQVTETEKVLAGDYGPDNVFFALRGQCYSLQAGQYTYEVCPFDKTRQDHVSLGCAPLQQGPLARQRARASSPYHAPS